MSSSLYQLESDPDRMSVMTNVSFVQMGPRDLDRKCDLTHVVKLANRCQEHFEFTVSDPIQSLGNPLADGSYTVDILVDVLLNNRVESDETVLVGVVDSEVGDKVFSCLDRKNRCIIISIDDVDSILKSTSTTLTGYVLVETAAQLLTLEYRRRTNISIDPDNCGDPWHEETRECLFYYCEKREHSGKKLMAPKMCLACQALFDKANMPQSVLMAGTKIFDEGVRRTFRRSLETVLKSRYGIFLISMVVTSGVIPTLRNVGISAAQLSAISLFILPLLIFIVWVYSNYSRMFKFQK